MKPLVRYFAPASIRQNFHRLRKLVGKTHYIGTRRHCSVCNRRSSRFADFDLRSYHGDNGVIPAIIVSDTQCPWCGAYLHHRLLWTILPDIIIQVSNSKTRIRLLHFAPESFSKKRLQNLSHVHYITTDFMSKDVSVQLDMCQLGLRNGSIDLIIASHVLEHVSDDMAALRELYRALGAGGKAIILVPLLAKKSYEDPNVVTEEDRLRLYGQKDHVRAYGLDLVDRINSVGFETELVSARSFRDLADPNYLLDVQGYAFIASKGIEEAKSGNVQTTML